MLTGGNGRTRTRYYTCSHRYPRRPSLTACGSRYVRAEDLEDRVVAAMRKELGEQGPHAHRQHLAPAGLCQGQQY